MKKIYKPLLNRYFPACPVDGPVTPSKMEHLGLAFLVPEKCKFCTFFHEGCCMRASEFYDEDEIRRGECSLMPMEFDFGPCPIIDAQKGIDSVKIERYGEAHNAYVPKKCVNCKNFTPTGECARYLFEYGLLCSLDFSEVEEVNI